MTILNVYRLRCQRPLPLFCLLNQRSKNPMFFYLNLLKKKQSLKILKSLRFYSECKTDKVSFQGYSDKSKSVVEKLKHLIKQYGIIGIYIYFGICVIDFGLVWIAVKYLGTTTIGFYEKKIISKIEDFTGWRLKNNEDSMQGNGKSKENDKASIWTEIAIVYGIHKLLIFVRVPLTAIFTPWLTRLLTQRKWLVGKYLKN